MFRDVRLPSHTEAETELLPGIENADAEPLATPLVPLPQDSTDTQSPLNSTGTVQGSKEHSSSGAGDMGHGGISDASDNLMGSIPLTGCGDGVGHPVVPSHLLEAVSDSLTDHQSSESKSHSLLSEADPDESQADCSKASLTSPVHSIRTPVTENDPLGLFTEALTAMTNTTNNVTVSPDKSGSFLAGHQDSGSTAGSSATLMSASGSTLGTPRGNLLIDVEPFGGSPRRSQNSSDRLGTSLTPKAKQSFSSSEASSPGSPGEAWAPLSQSLSVGNPPGSPAHYQGDGGHLATSTPTHSNRTVARSESFHATVRGIRGVASRFATRFTEFKQSMSTPPQQNSGSSGSLNRSIGDMERLSLSDDSRDHGLRKAGSADMLDGHSMGSGEDLANTSRGKLRLPSKYTPFGKLYMCFPISIVLPFKYFLVL